MEKSSNKKLCTFLLLTFLFILQTFLYENYTCSTCNAVYFQDPTYIELVYQPETRDVPQINDDSTLNDLKNVPSAYALQHVLNEELKLLHLRDNWEKDVIVEKHIDLPSSHILTILKKKNNCHQSSDDKPLPHIYL